MSNYLTGAKELYQAAYQPSYDILNQQLTAQQPIYAAQRANLEAAIPLNQQRYQALLAELEAKDAETQGEIKTEGTAAIGETRARAGASGTYSSGIEQGQEAIIGQNVAKLIKSQAETTARNKITYSLNRDENELKIRTALSDLASEESEQGFKIRKAIAAIGPEMIDKAISLAAKLATDQRAQEELALSKEKFAYEKTKDAGGTKSEKALAGLRTAVAGGANLESLISQFGGEIDNQTIYNLWNAGPISGSKKYSAQELYKMGIDAFSDADATTAQAEAIKTIRGFGSRKEAENELAIMSSTWQDQRVDINAVQAVIDQKWPNKTSGTSSRSRAPYTNVVDYLLTPNTGVPSYQSLLKK
jgi:hypothetical protein